MLGWMIVGVALAGDPCPIDFRVSNLGPLSKAGAVPLEEDGIWKHLIGWLGSEDCVNADTKTAKDGKLPVEDGSSGGLAVWRLQELLIDDSGAFRCDDAHEPLAALSAIDRSAHVIYQRGTRRTLLTTAGWQTICVNNVDLQKGGDPLIEKLWKGATAKVVENRYANP